MKLTPYIILLAAFVCITHSSILSKVQDNVLSFLEKTAANYQIFDDKKGNKEKSKALRTIQKLDPIDVKRAKAKAKIMKKAREKNLESSGTLLDAGSVKWRTNELTKQHYVVDPVLNFLSRRTRKRKYDSDSSNDPTSSSSLELPEWKDEWREQWIQKKFEAINSSAPLGDSVNMVAARPWGTPCGDPNQHDMPWGSCMLPMECDPEFRVFRGDYFCGRTQFVCCALQLTTYDMYQGFDISFENSNLETDSEELRSREMGSHEKRRKRKMKEKKRRRAVRQKRKRVIRRKIKRIVKEIRKILSRTYRNGTTARKRKTKQLKKFVKLLKKRYKKDRKSVKDIHEHELMLIDQKLQKRLNQIKGMNQDFIKNQTFRDIIVNGSVSPKAMRMLAEAYPDLLTSLDGTRRHSKVEKPDYDVEYGLLYY